MSIGLVYLTLVNINPQVYYIQFLTIFIIYNNSTVVNNNLPIK